MRSPRPTGFNGNASRSFLFWIFLFGFPLCHGQVVVSGTADKPGATAASADSDWKSSNPAPAATPAATPDAAADPAPGGGPGAGNLRRWLGQQVIAVEFHGVDAARLAPLPSQLALQPGAPLDAARLRQSLRRLYATGLYQGIDVQAMRSARGVTIIFDGVPRLFVGRVKVHGVKSDRLTTLLERSTKLDPGTPAIEAKLKESEDLVLAALKENGYYLGSVAASAHPDPLNEQVNMDYQVVLGAQSRVGEVKVDGNSGLSLAAFRKKAKLKQKAKVDRETVSRALSRLRNHYQKEDRLEADISLQQQEFQPPVNRLDYQFKASQGPIVKVEVTGVKLSAGKIKKLIPVYEEGAVDEDLLNEGNRNLRDYYQRRGYFDVDVTHTETNQTTGRAVVTYHVETGAMHRVDSIEITGNKYFDNDTLSDRLSVHRADAFDRHGLYSLSLQKADVASISALYQSNGFSNVKVTAFVTDTDNSKNGKLKAFAHLKMRYAVVEGTQQKIGKVEVSGTEKVAVADLQLLLNTQAGQPYSPANLAGDRDSLLTYYLSRGFDHADVVATQKTDPNNAALVDVSMKITEGEQVFVNRVLISGLRFTRPGTVDRLVQVHAGDALNESALLDTQRRLYDLALFNEVNTAVQNPTGDELRKNVLLQLTEARRWDINYGFGFEAQTGTPQRHCLSPAAILQLGLVNYSCSQGKTGVSPRVLFDVTRINLRGGDQSVTLRTSYGTLEQRAILSLQTPHLFGNPDFDLTFSGGYSNVQDVTTYAASRAEASVRVTEHFTKNRRLFNRAHTFIYDVSFRRVKVDESSVQVSPNQIPLLSQSARIGGPGLTWLRDTRAPSPLDARSGSYTSLQEFLSYSRFGSQSDFTRLDLTNSTYHAFGKPKWILARNTRLGYQRSFGSGNSLLIPLPERLYAGGATSHRGFAINAAGPRDPETGFPIGGAGAFVNSTEFRLPPPELPFFGNNLSFVLFHDMGNVFKTSSDIGPSLLHLSQPHRDTCKILLDPPPAGAPVSSLCSFNYFSHAIGIGPRYHTPIGPVRVDFSYNVNPPIYPVVIQYNNVNPITNKHVSQASHFNFFFSIGQTF